MGKVARTAATILNIAALIPGPQQPFVAAAAMAANVVSAVTASKPMVNGSGGTVDFRADPQAGIPYGMGESAWGGNAVFIRTAGEHSKYQNFFTVLGGGGPYEQIVGFTANKEAVSFTANGGEGASGRYLNRMWMRTQLGAAKEPALRLVSTGTKDTPGDHNGNPSEWTSEHRLSGLAAAQWALEYDTAVYPQTPKPLWRGKWAKVYDPRKDSTYPGGSGPHRWADPSDTAAHDAARLTWEWSADPYLHGLMWALGRWDRDPTVPGSTYKRVLGAGMPFSAVDVARFVEGANVAQANGWTVNGVVYSTDDKWEVLKLILECGAGEPIRLGSMLSCIVNMPRVSIATLTGADIRGDDEKTLAGAQTARERYTGVVPRYVSEDHEWQVVPAEEIVVPEYVAADGRPNTTEVEFKLVTDALQATQLATYKLEDSREFGPITLPLQPQWMGLRPGDCFTVNEPELGLNGQKLLALRRSRDLQSLAPTLTCRSETDGKHPFALGQTPNPPPTPGLTGVDLTVVAAPGVGSWSASGGTMAGEAGAVPAIIVTGAVDNPYAVGVVVDLRQQLGAGSFADWATVEFPASATTLPIGPLVPGATYEVAVRYRSNRGVENPDTALDLGLVAAGTLTATDTHNVGGRPASGTGGLLDQVDGLITTYGDTVAAAASAAAAEAARSAAVTAQGLAQTARTDAQAAVTAAQGARDTAIAQATAASGSASVAAGSATTASQKADAAAGSATAAAGSATAASTSAGSASTSASNAATSATNAAGSASSAATSSTTAATARDAARQAAAAIFPPVPDDVASQFTNPGATGSPASAAAFPTSKVGYVDFVGRYLQLDGTAGVATRGVVPANTAAVYEVEATLYANVAPSGVSIYPRFAAHSLLGDYSSTDSTPYAGGPLGAVTGTATPWVAGETRTIRWRFGLPAATGRTIWVDSATAKYLRFWVDNQKADFTAHTGQFLLTAFTVRDVTALSSAETQASAAATSASNAAASATTAGQQASAASTSATNAATSASNAATSAGQAAASETNAAGSTASAGTYATNAANSATASGNSASAASTSASTASTKASEAAASATAASGSATTASGHAGAAASSASAASSSAAAASGSAAAAQQSATLSASVGQRSINSNPTFANWPNAASWPTGYAAWVGVPSDMTRIAGYDSPYAVRYAVTAAQGNLGFVQTDGVAGAGPGLRASGPGYYVLEADVFGESGNWTGSGLYLQAINEDGTLSNGVALNFATDKDARDVVSATDMGRRYFSKLVQITLPTASRLQLYAMANWGGLGTATTKTIQFHKALVRAATREEIAANRADANASTALANITSEASTRAAADAAEALARTTLESTVNGHTATLSSQAGTLALHDGRLAAWLEIVAAAGSDPARARIVAGSAGSAIALSATQLLFENYVGGSPVKVLELVNGRPFFSNPVYADVAGKRLIVGPGFGASSDLVLWFGLTAQDQTTATKTNGYFALATDGKVYLGNAELTSGGGGGGDVVRTLRADFSAAGSNNTNWVSIAQLAFTSLPSGGFFSVGGYANGGGVTLSGTSTFYGTWRLAQNGVAVAGVGGAFTAQDTGGGLIDVVGIDLPTAPIAQSGSGSITLALQIQRASGVGNISGMNGTFYATRTG